LQKAKRIPEALGAFKKGVEVDPENPEVHNAIGVLLVELGQLDKAIECFRKAIALSGFDSLPLSLHERPTLADR
jgi:tetratricopeptide (TPR) repeat protein